MVTFVDIPKELILGIASLCSKAQVNALCQTCRALNTTCTPELYRTIDLSSHNAQNLCKPIRRWWYFVLVPPDFIGRFWTPLDRSIFQRQTLLLRTFEANQAYGAYVRTLCWTVMDTEFKSVDEHAILDRQIYPATEDIPNIDDYPYFEHEDEPLWAMFRCFSNVSDVDICWLREYREVTPPGPLFPSLSALRLSGCMSLEFVSCIMQQRSLQHLDLNNLHEWANTHPPLPRLSHLRDLARFVDSHYASVGRDSTIRPMLGHIDPIIDQLENLQTLRIGTFGIEKIHLRDPHTTSVYESWARLLNAVRPTLQEFYFDQGYNGNDHLQPCQPQRTVPFVDKLIPEYRQMDDLFVENILPVLLQAPWPRVKRMHIRGVGRTTLEYKTSVRPKEEELPSPGVWRVAKKLEDETEGYLVEQTVVAVPMHVREQLRGLLGGGNDARVEFVFEEAQGRDWERPERLGMGIPSVRQWEKRR